MSSLAEIQGLDARARELNAMAAAAERLARAPIDVPRVSVPTPDQFIPNSATSMADQALRDIANNIEVNVQIGDESLEDIIVTTSKKAEDKSAFFSRLVAAGAE